MKPQRRAFTLVELLVVIGIIALLVSILVPLVGVVRRKAATTASNQLLIRISQAIDSYNQVFHAYPGLFPNSAFQVPGNVNASFMGGTFGPGQVYTQAEDLVMALLGGIDRDPATGALRIQTKLSNPSDPNSQKIVIYQGTGPVTFNVTNPGKKSAFMDVTPNDVSAGWINSPAYPDQRLNLASVVPGKTVDSFVPEFIDHYSDPRPVLYLRTNAGATPGNANLIVSDIPNGYQPNYHYNLNVIAPYLDPSEYNKPYNTKPRQRYDFLNATAVGTAPEPVAIRSYFSTQNASGNVANAKFAGGYMLISAGPDRIYGTEDDIVVGGGGK